MDHNIHGSMHQRLTNLANFVEFCSQFLTSCSRTDITHTRMCLSANRTTIMARCVVTEAGPIEKVSVTTRPLPSRHRPFPAHPTLLPSLPAPLHPFSLYPFIFPFPSQLFFPLPISSHRPFLHVPPFQVPLPLPKSFPNHPLPLYSVVWESAVSFPRPRCMGRCPLQPKLNWVHLTVKSAVR